MSDLSAAAAALGIPEALVQRSAEARAAETGASVDEILAAWAGGESGPAAAAPAEPEETEEAAEPADVAEADEAPDEAPATPEVTIEIPEEKPAATAPAAVSRTPVPTEVTAAEAANLPVVVTVPTSGIKERTNFAVPKWLAVLFFIAPLVALFALGGSATGECGSATELTTNVITGEIVNCDGSEFTGSAVGGGGTDFIALGEAIYQGGEVSGVNCAGCHGAGGGGGAGPAMNAVLTVFGSCADHSEWVALATAGLQAAGESTYGDTNKPLGGFGAPMPGFANSLTDEQIAAVSAFERVRFGGQDPEAALIDCGLAEDPEAEGEGEEGGEGEDGAGVDQPPDTTDMGEGETDGEGDGA
ncbi:MAG: c-type cytochrome [Acidimicrobiia bacterium]